MEIVQLTSPVLIQRSNSICDILRWIIIRLEVVDSWQYELAAQLCLLGCMMIPNEIFEKAYGRQELTAEQAEMFRLHPEVAAGLIARIPRLEIVAAIIRMQQAPGADVTDTEPSKQGAHMLHLALKLDQQICRGLDWKSAIVLLRGSGKFNGRMLDALTDYAPINIKYELRQLLIQDLRSGMVLDEDVFTVTMTTLLFKSGMVLTSVWIERLRNFARTNGVQKRFLVRVPRLWVDPSLKHGRRFLRIGIENRVMEASQC